MILHENKYSKVVVALCVEELGNMSQNKLKGTFRKLLIVINNLTLHPLLIWTMPGLTRQEMGSNC